jgi:hypothetical protein
MANGVSDRSITAANERNERLTNALARVKAEGTKAARTAMRTGTAVASAAGLGYFEGRFPEQSEAFGAPVSLLAGVGLALVGGMGWAGDKQTNELLEAAGIGALCHYAGSKGKEMGAEALAAA